MDRPPRGPEPLRRRLDLPVDAGADREVDSLPASSSAMASPKPFDAPVTMAFLPAIPSSVNTW